MPIKQIIYKCPYCNKYTNKDKQHVLTHESHCFRNPSNKACLTCKNSIKRLRTFKERENYVGFVYECVKHNVLLYRLNYSSDDITHINTDKANNTIAIRKPANYITGDDEKKLVFPTNNCKDHCNR